MQKLYDDLVAKGSASRAAAVQVGISIETMDIADLEAAIAQTDEAQLDRAYGNLLAGSQRHLQAFERNLTCDGTCKTGARAGAGKRAGRDGNGVRAGVPAAAQRVAHRTSRRTRLKARARQARDVGRR